MLDIKLKAESKDLPPTIANSERETEVLSFVL